MHLEKFSSCCSLHQNKKPPSLKAAYGIHPRLDYQINQQHTLVARNAFTHSNVKDAGIGGFKLSSRSPQLLNTSHTLQPTETAVINNTTINETRFQFNHNANESVPNSSDPALLVLGSFNVGGA